MSVTIYNKYSVDMVLCIFEFRPLDLLIEVYLTVSIHSVSLFYFVIYIIVKKFSFVFFTKLDFLLNEIF